MADYLTLAELQAGLPDILSAPADDGTVSAIVVRPRTNERNEVEACEVSSAGGVHGDNWVRKSWIKTEDGQPHPDAQISIMSARAINLIAGGKRENWAPAGDNLFIDLDLSPLNLPTGQRLAIGSAIIEVTSEPHLGCAKFSKRYGRDAVVFVNKGAGLRQRLRGVYARVVQDGRIRVGDRVRKIAESDKATAHDERRR